MKGWIFVIYLLLAALTIEASEPSPAVNCDIKRKCSGKYMPVCGGKPGCTATFQNDCIFETYVCNNKLKDYRIIKREPCPIITLGL